MEEIKTLSYDWEYGKEELALKVTTVAAGSISGFSVKVRMENGNPFLT